MRCLALLALLVVVLGSLVPCQAQNLLPNPEFDNDVSGWTPPQFYTNDLVWDFHHSAFGPGGSGLLTTNYGINGALVTTACVPVTPGVTYTFGGQYLFPVATGEHSIQFSVALTSDPGCVSALTASATDARYPGPGSAGQWQILSGGFIVAPANAQAALFSVISASTADPEMHAVYFDDLYFGPAGTVGPTWGSEIPALSLSGLLALALGLAAAAVWTLLRRRPASAA